LLEDVTEGTRLAFGGRVGVRPATEATKETEAALRRFGRFSRATPRGVASEIKRRRLC
jgi:hypothetical protein